MCIQFSCFALWFVELLLAQCLGALGTMDALGVLGAQGAMGVLGAMGVQGTCNCLSLKQQPLR